MDEIESSSFAQKNRNKYSDNHFHLIENALGALDDKIRAVTFNVLFTHSDQRLAPEHRWDERKHRVLEAIGEMECDILGVQEPYDPQIDYLKKELSDYEYFGAVDGSKMNHGIFFKKDRFECVEKESFHLESSDEAFSKVTQDPKWLDKRKEFVHLKLIDKKTAKIIHVFNAHMSFFQPNWREMEAHVMHTIAKGILEKDAKALGSEPAAILMGDWNSFDNRPDMSLPFFDGNRFLKILKGQDFVDGRTEALLGYIGATSSFTNDPEKEGAEPFLGLGNPGIVLDQMFVSKKVTPILGAINPILIDGKFPSDHMPVVLDLLVQD